MYGRLCLRLSNELPKIQTWIDMDAKNNIFRRLLLNKCQEEFENSEKWSKEDNAGEESRQERVKRLHSMTSEEKAQYAQDEYDRTKLKRRVLGNVTFIGELFKLNMITEKIMHMCVFQLLTEVNSPGEEEVESICKLMSTIGERLDHEKGKPTVDVYFGRIKALSVNMLLSSRIRFMLQDLIEMRRNKWKGRQEATGPKTIAEIHAAAEKKLKEEEEARQKSSGGRGGDRGGDRRGGGGGRDRDRDNRDRDHGGRRGGNNQQQDRQNSGRGGPQDARAQNNQPNSDGWSTVGGGASADKSRREDSYNNFGRADVKKNVSGMRLGPQAPAWGKGGAAQKKEEPKPVKNQFSLLSGTSNEDIKTDVVESPATVTPVAAAGISEEQARLKIEGMVQEWFSIFDISELTASLKELSGFEYNGKFLLHFINQTLEKKSDVVSKSANVLPDLIASESLTAEEVVAALTEVAATLDDISVDVPGAYKFFGVLYGGLMASDDSAFSLAVAAEILEPCIETPMRKPPVPQVISCALDTIRTIKTEAELINIFARQTTDLQAFWPEAKRSEEVVAAWKQENNLTCLDSAPIFEAESDLASRLLVGDASAVLAWVEETVDDATRGTNAFVHELTSGFLELLGSTTIFVNGVETPLELSRELFQEQEKIITSHKALFDLCLENRENRSELELEVLLACQEYWFRTGAIATFLEHLFRIFTRYGIVDSATEDAWLENDASDYQESKAAAVEEVAKYLQSRS
ncbi:armadillo-type protein [Obelidium mucronatum]|nr:armadillo-type protein [Obelidium mucronatum]